MRDALLELLNPIRSSLSDQEWSTLQRADQLLIEKRLPTHSPVGIEIEEETLGIIRILLRMHLDADSICTALLMPLTQNGLLSNDELEELFGKDVALLSKRLLKLPTFSFPELVGQDDKSQQQLLKDQAESFRRMLLSMSRDMRVVMLKFCERLYRIEILEFLPVKQQRILAYECRQIYAPLANRLGISWIKNDMEDLSLRYLFPKAFYDLVSQISSKQKERQEYIEEVQHTLEQLVREHNISCEVQGRSKHINSIYNKMLKKNLTFEQLFDVTAFRLICQTKAECYQLLGEIHHKWKPIPGRFKDYIGVPKPNMYQSLHTTVLGPHNKRMEVQIRTAQMHMLAEDGIAAHWLYKEKNPQSKEKNSQSQAVQQFQWLRNLLSLKDERDDAQAFMASVRDYLEEGEVFVFTPKGHVKELPKGATPVDFAYAIHTDVGHRCTGAKVNNKIVPLRYELQNGDLVDILTSPSSEPNRDWLKFATTHRAKSKIRSHLRGEQRKEALTLGRELLEKELPSSNKSINKLLKNGTLGPVLEQLNFTSFEEMLMQIGYNKLAAEEVVERLFPPKEKIEITPDTIPLKAQAPQKRSSRGVLVDGMEDILAQMAGCCHPIPGDPIVGFISQGRGVIVHTETCKKVLSTPPERRVEVSWDNSQNANHSVVIRIISENRPGLLSLQSKIFGDLKINISSANCEADNDTATNIFKCQVSDLEQLQRLLRQLEDIRGVISVDRLRN